MVSLCTFLDLRTYPDSLVVRGLISSYYIKEPPPEMKYVGFNLLKSRRDVQYIKYIMSSYKEIHFD